MDMIDLIPTIPTVRFENYLDQLLDHRDGFTSPIRVRGIERFADKIVEEIGQTAVKNELEISPACLRGWANGRRGMPLSSLKKIVEMLFDPNLRSPVWNKIFTRIRYYTLGGSPHRVTLPLFVTPRLLYFVGYLYGDGCISDAHKRSYKKGGLLYEIKIADSSHEQIEHISKLFYHLFNVQAKIRDERIRKGEQTYYIDPKCKIVHRFLNRVFEMPIGEKKGKLRVPSTVFQSPPNLRKWFIAGFFDADGSIFRVERSNSQMNVVKLKQMSLQILRDIQHLLAQDMGITLLGPYEESAGAWSISSGKHNTIEKFCASIPLIHPDKRQYARKIIPQKSQDRV